MRAGLEVLEGDEPEMMKVPCGPQSNEFDRTRFWAWILPMAKLVRERSSKVQEVNAVR